MGDGAVNKLGPVMGAEIAGVDLPKPLDEAVFRLIRETFHRHQLIVFRDQRLTETPQIAFSRRFGELQVHVLDSEARQS